MKRSVFILCLFTLSINSSSGMMKSKLALAIITKKLAMPSALQAAPKLASLPTTPQRFFSSNSHHSDDIKFFKGSFGSELKGEELAKYSKYEGACDLFSIVQEDIEKLEQLSQCNVGEKRIFFRPENVPTIALLHNLLELEKSKNKRKD